MPLSCSLFSLSVLSAWLLGPCSAGLAGFGVFTSSLSFSLCGRSSLSCQRGWLSQAALERMSPKAWCLSRISRKSTQTCRRGCGLRASRPTFQVPLPCAGGVGVGAGFPSRASSPRAVQGHRSAAAHTGSLCTRPVAGVVLASAPPDSQRSGKLWC